MIHFVHLRIYSGLSARSWFFTEGSLVFVVRFFSPFSVSSLFPLSVYSCLCHCFCAFLGLDFFFVHITMCMCYLYSHKQFYVISSVSHLLQRKRMLFTARGQSKSVYVFVKFREKNDTKASNVRLEGSLLRMYKFTFYGIRWHWMHIKCNVRVENKQDEKSEENHDNDDEWKRKRQRKKKRYSKNVMCEIFVYVHTFIVPPHMV